MPIDIHTHAHSENGIHNLIVGKENELPAYSFSAGIHPWYISPTLWEDQLSDLKRWAAEKNCVAIGEAGLDKRCETPWDLQTDLFQKQIELTNECQKPMIIHCVKAHQELLTFKKGGQTPWILHGFNQKTSIGDQMIEQGLYISMGKALLLPTSNASQMIKRIPLEQLFLETDDAPLAIAEIYEAASERLHLPIEKLAAILQANFDRVFGPGASFIKK